MPEQLLPFDVEQYTRGRLSQTDPETTRLLDAALARARRYCGWHVSPVITETITLDGHGDRFLPLPTKRIGAVVGIDVDGVPIDLSEVQQHGSTLIRWIWPCGYANIEVEFTHGFTAAEAVDFREAVLRMVDQSASIAAEGGTLVSKTVDDVSYRWASGQDLDPGVAAILAPFRRLWAAV